MIANSLSTTGLHQDRGVCCDERFEPARGVVRLSVGVLEIEILGLKQGEKRVEGDDGRTLVVVEWLRVREFHGKQGLSAIDGQLRSSLFETLMRGNIVPSEYLSMIAGEKHD